MLLYTFDLHGKCLKAYNTLKRRFYYQLKKSGIATAPFKTKSVVLVPDELEKQADAFFLQWEGSITVFKSRVSEVQQLA
jgi:hypothetical protein